MSSLSYPPAQLQSVIFSPGIPKLAWFRKGWTGQQVSWSTYSKARSDATWKNTWGFFPQSWPLSSGLWNLLDPCRQTVILFVKVPVVLDYAALWDFKDDLCRLRNSITGSTSTFESFITLWWSFIIVLLVVSSVMGRVGQLVLQKLSMWSFPWW